MILGRWIAIAWLGFDGISIQSRASTPDRSAHEARERRRRWSSPGNQFPRQRGLGTRRTWPRLVFRGSIRPVLGSGVVSAACVIHLGSKRGSGLLGAACAAKGAGLHGGVRVEFRRRRGSDRGKRARGRSWARGGAPAGVLGGCGAAERPGRGSVGVRCGGARRRLRGEDEMQERPGIPFIGRLRPRRACLGC